MQPTQRTESKSLETKLVNMLIADLTSRERDEDVATTLKFIRTDTDDTVPHVLCSTPYERIEIESAPAPAPLRPRKRATTIPRVQLAQLAHAAHPAQTLVRSIDGDDTLRFVRYSTPYERIEIELECDVDFEPAPRPSGSFEAAWFGIPEDVISASEEETERVRTGSSRVAVITLVFAAALGAVAAGMGLAFLI